MSARSVIKLSVYQAEGRRVTSTAHCLFIIILTAILIYILYSNFDFYLKFISSLIWITSAVYIRFERRYKCYNIFRNYLHTKNELEKYQPDKLQLFGFGLFMTALRAFVVFISFTPSIMCVYEGVRSYSMSGAKIKLISMLGASISFAASGIILAVLFLCCLSGAEYIYFSGIKYTPLSAAEYSIEVMSEVCGEYLSLCIISILHSGKVAELCKNNFISKRLANCIDGEMKMVYNLYVCAE